MSQQMKRALTQLSQSMYKNLPHVKHQLSKAGVSSDSPLVYSVAKYYTALNKLAEEK